MGFSPFGLAVSVLVLAPTLLLLVLPPRGPAPAPRVPPALGWLERAGQALCTVVPVITAPGSLVWGWAIPTGAALLGYGGFWIRYLTAGRRYTLLYDDVARLPVPMAILPVAIFAAAACWLSNPWIGVAAAVLAAGHIPAAVITARSLDLRS